jgi:transposase-like protein
MVRTTDHKFSARLAMVMWAKTHGIHDAARKFGCSRNTVRLWLRRFEAGGRGALVERSRAPHRCPHRISKAAEKRILAARDDAPFMGPRRLKDLNGLRPSLGAIARVLRQHGRTRKPRRKHQKKNDLREVKRQYRAFERIQADTKPLFDIPAYWPQMKALHLPWHLYTHRDVKTGALFTDYADELSTSHATISTRRVIGRLERHGHLFDGQRLSTDNGSEYGGTDKHLRQVGYHAVVGSLHVEHRFLPPASPKCHADVETVHGWIEREFFDWETFTSRADFFEKAAAYQNWWNFARPNYSKGDGKTGKTPTQLLREEGIDPRVLLLTADDLDAHLRHDPRGYHLGHYLPVAPT